MKMQSFDLNLRLTAVIIIIIYAGSSIFKDCGMFTSIRYLKKIMIMGLLSRVNFVDIISYCVL